ncbi:MAG: hypothetical protein U0835_25930 [Isosphaeraceae bacterium]
MLVTRPGSDMFNPAYAKSSLPGGDRLGGPNVAELWNTLGVAHYRAGDRAAAEAALRRSMELSAGGTPNDWLFLAMSRWEEGSKTEAKELYDRSTAWMARNPKLALDPDLQSFVRETAAKLCVPEPPAPAVPKRSTEKPTAADRSEWVRDPVVPPAPSVSAPPRN